ncbi:hypothetical protein [Nocardia altamirensis]|uniref:hypothetical protein n=1 Tax=Nocardia altamirensis TaxID=472158 RepID=UPI0008407C46|nr:hypothetical protein [Nocardia altamirensis]
MGNEYDDEYTLDKIVAIGNRAHGVITKILLALPIPIEVAPYEGADPEDAVDSIANARTLLRDMPIDEEIRDAIAATLLGWLTATTLAAIEPLRDGSDNWMLEAAHHQMVATSLRTRVVYQMVTSI